MNTKQIANDIVNHFMHKGAVISKKDFDCVIDLLGADAPCNEECERENPEEESKRTRWEADYEDTRYFKGKNK